MRTPIEALRLLVGANWTYTIRLACSADDARAAQALRFAVFNLEQNESQRGQPILDLRKLTP